MDRLQAQLKELIVSPGPAATLRQRGCCHPGVPEVLGGSGGVAWTPRSGPLPIWRLSYSPLVPSRYLITNTFAPLNDWLL